MDLLYAVNSPEKFNFSDSRKGTPSSVYEQEKEPRLVAVGAYCLMPNHFHILITPLSDQGLSIFMQKLSTAYVMYFNEKYKRSGSLFEGKFKAEHLNNDRYLKYIFSYIHLNPLKLIQKDWREVGLKNKQVGIKYLKSYKYSSLMDYLGLERMQNIILSQHHFPKYFSKIKNFTEEMMYWIEYHKIL